MKEYIKKTALNALKENKEKFLYKKIPLIILEPFKEEENRKISILDVQSILEKNIPLNYLRNIEGLYVGNFKALNKRNINSMYKDGVIYVSNLVTDEVDSLKIAKDIVHEIAHSLDDFNSIWDDQLISNEFLGKRKRLYQILISNLSIKIPENLFYEIDFDLKFDNLLYNVIGYRKLTPLIVNLFTSPYSITSLDEYYANGFEEYNLGDKNGLKEICPILYKKIEFLCDQLKEN